jgi:hypothetical protein
VDGLGASLRDSTGPISVERLGGRVEGWEKRAGMMRRE